MSTINIGKEIKISLLGAIAVTSIWTLGEMIFSPLPQRNSFLEQKFSEEISLEGLQVNSGNLPQHFDADRLKTIPGKSYVYDRDNALVNIQMHYITSGHNVKTLIKKYTSLPHQSLEVLQQETIGSYGLIVHQDKLHLSSCITPQGSMMANEAKLYQSYPAVRSIYNRLVFWLLGEKPIVKNVCLWSHLSIPIENSPETAYLTLEKVWLAWYEHWHPYLVTILSNQ